MDTTACCRSSRTSGSKCSSSAARAGRTRPFYTVVTVGSSTTQCVFLDDSKAWPQVLQDTLRARIPRVWVGNAGLDGHSSRSHVLLMHDVVSRIRPDAVLVLASVNDMLNSALGYVRKLQPYELRRRPSWLLDHSALLRRLTAVQRRLFGGPPGVAYGLPKPPPPFTGKDPPTADVRPMLPTLGEFHDNLRTIVRDGRALGIRVVLLTQPLLYEDTPHWRALDGTANWATTHPPRLSAGAVWRLLDAEEQSECLDLAGAVPHSGAYFYDWCHFNEGGAHLVAETIARSLEASIAKAVSSRQ